MNKSKSSKRNPWFWVPTLYYAEGIPYVVVMTVSVIMYKRLGISNADIALYTSWLYLPWVIKPLWSPIVDIFKTKRLWIIVMQLFIGAGLAGVALTIPVPDFFQYTLAFFWLLAFSSATHDIAADGFYMLGLDEHEQAFFVGIRSTFYRLAMITGQGLLIIVAGYLESTTGLPTVELQVKSSTQMENIKLIQPDSLKINSLEGELRIVTYPEKVVIPTVRISRQKADSLKAYVHSWNSKNGFLKELRVSSGNGKGNDHGNVSWWHEYVVSNIEYVLRSLFGPEKKVEIKTDYAGNIGLIYFYLSKEPDSEDDIVVNFGSEGGDKSIKLAEGSRFVFNKTNWNKPAVALIQLDPKLKKESSAEFAARAGNIPLSWIITFSILAGLFILFFVYHKFILPYPASDKAAKTNDGESAFADFFKAFAIFFKKKHIGIALTFILLYRLGESQLVKLASPFLLDAREVGGLGLTTGEVGIVYGTVGILALTIGGIIGGILASKDGMKKWLWPMMIAINLPNAVYIYLAYVQPESLFIINACVAIEQFGYGFGFTAFMLFMIYISEGEFKTAHFAITTGFMALGMMIPGMVSGWLQEIIGYQHFFVWVLIATVPAFVVARYIHIDPEYGKKPNTKNE